VDQWWEGMIETRLKANEDRVRDLDRKADRTTDAIVKLRVQVVQLRTQVGIWSAVGGVVGAGVVSGIVALLGGHSGS
jgi:hypothetical protein